MVEGTPGPSSNRLGSLLSFLESLFGAGLEYGESDQKPAASFAMKQLELLWL